MLVITLVTIQTIFDGQFSMYCTDTGLCTAKDVGAATAIKIVGVIFWSAILQFLCSRGLSIVAWGLLAIPFLFFAVNMKNAILLKN